jgi:hypothetical protein
MLVVAAMLVVGAGGGCAKKEPFSIDPSTPAPGEARAETESQPATSKPFGRSSITLFPDGTCVGESDPPVRPGEYRLFFRRVPDRGNTPRWSRCPHRADNWGRYLYLDFERNISVLVIANVPDLPHWTRNETADAATICPGSAFEMRVQPEPNTLTVVLLDKTQCAFPLCEGAVQAFWDHREQPYSVVDSVLRCLGDSIDPELETLLRAHR